MAGSEKYGMVCKKSMYAFVLIAFPVYLKVNVF